MTMIVHDMSQKIALPSAVKRKVQKEIERILKPIYFKAIPLQGIADAIRPLGVYIISEDGTEWAGFLTGADGRAHFDLAYNGLYVKNAALYLTWHKMEVSGNYEIVGYIS